MISLAQGGGAMCSKHIRPRNKSPLNSFKASLTAEKEFRKCLVSEECTPVDEKHHVRCCGYRASQKLAYDCSSKMSFEKAEHFCESKGLRLCSNIELRQCPFKKASLPFGVRAETCSPGACGPKGYRHRVWSSSPGGAHKIA